MEIIETNKNETKILVIVRNFRIPENDQMIRLERILRFHAKKEEC